MKKILAVAVAIMGAAITQAATITWASGALTDAAGKSPAAGAVTAYIFVLDSEEAWNALTPSADLSKATASQDSTVSKGTAKADLKSVTIGGSEAAPQYVAIFYKDNTTGDVTGYKTTAWENNLGTVSTGSAFPDGAFTAAVTGGAGYGKGIYNGISGKVEVVPEPTAIALIALGLAAFGLKRKVA